jgi:hypothetical protein
LVLFTLVNAHACTEYLLDVSQQVIVRRFAPRKDGAWHFRAWTDLGFTGRLDAPEKDDRSRFLPQAAGNR